MVKSTYSFIGSITKKSMNLTQYIYQDLIMFVNSKQQMYVQAQEELLLQSQNQQNIFPPFRWFMTFADYCYCNTLTRQPITFQVKNNKRTRFDEYIWQSSFYCPMNIYHVIEKFTFYNMITIEGYYMSKFLIEKFLQATNSEITLENFWIIFIIAICVSMKFIEDSPYNNYTFGHISSVNLHVLNDLELFFLQQLNFSINYEEFTEKHYSQLIV